MGINTTHKQLTYQVTGLMLPDLIKVIQQRCTDRRIKCEDEHLVPTIDVDVSWIIRRQYTKSIKSRVEYIILLCNIFCTSGIRVVLVCDGQTRFHTKRATLQRQSNAYKNKVKLYFTRSDIIKNAEKLSVCKDETEIIILKTEKEQLQKDCSRLESSLNANTVDVGDDLFTMLLKEVNEYNKNHTGNVNNDGERLLLVIQALSQADYTISYRLIHMRTDIALMSDTDIAALSGSFCLSIKNFKIIQEKNRNNTINDIEIFSGNYDPINMVCNTLNWDIDVNHPQIHIPPYPFFDICNDPYVAALISVGLGCDVNIGGIFGVTVATFFRQLKKFLSESESDMTSLVDKIIKYYVKTHCKKMCNETEENQQQVKRHIYTLTQAFLYEPANLRLSANSQFPDNTLYLTNNPPTHLHPYCSVYARGDITVHIDNEYDNDVHTCVGSGNGSHPFLIFEACNTCFSCNSLTCIHCSFHSNHNNMDADVNYCVNCFMSETSISFQRLENIITKEDMITKLSIEANTELQQSDTLKDVMDIYDALIDNPKNQVYSDDTLFSLMYPVESTYFLDQCEDLSNTYDIKDGGAIITDPALTTFDRFCILQLISELVYFDTDTESSDRNSCTTIIPSIIIKFAKGARIHNGYRLCKRAVRHAIDPLCPSILSAKWFITKYDGDIAISITHNIKASMKVDIYEVRLIFTCSDLISCSCNCKAGAVGTDKVLCVHILPVLYSLSQLLFDGLASHLLGEFMSVFTASDEESVKGDNRTTLVQSIQRLHLAANIHKDSSVYENATSLDFDC